MCTHSALLTAIFPMAKGHEGVDPGEAPLAHAEGAHAEGAHAAVGEKYLSSCRYEFSEKLHAVAADGNNLHATCLHIKCRQQHAYLSDSDEPCTQQMMEGMGGYLVLLCQLRNTVAEVRACALFTALLNS